jgi:YHS domain-containing protein
MGRLLSYLFEVVIIFLLVKVVGRALQALFGVPQVHLWTRSDTSSRDTPRETRQGETARDPVCGMFVSTELSHRLNRGAEILHFCSRECLERYQKDAANTTS